MALLTDYYSEVDFLGWDLEVDHVVTASQALRWYRLRQRKMVSAGLVLEPRHLKRSQKASAFQRMMFVMRNAKQARSSTTSLYHLAGTAEIRAALGAGLGGWSSTAWREAATMIPDAIWTRDNGEEVAIEFDTGAYSRKRIIKKAEAFSEFAGQVWGSTTERRADRVRALVQDVDSRAQVMVAAPYL